MKDWEDVAPPYWDRFWLAAVGGWGAAVKQKVKPVRSGFVSSSGLCFRIWQIPLQGSLSTSDRTNIPFMSSVSLHHGSFYFFVVLDVHCEFAWRLENDSIQQRPPAGLWPTSESWTSLKGTEPSSQLLVSTRRHTNCSCGHRSIVFIDPVKNMKSIFYFMFMITHVTYYCCCCVILSISLNFISV